MNTADRNRENGELPQWLRRPLLPRQSLPQELFQNPRPPQVPKLRKGHLLQKLSLRPLRERQQRPVLFTSM
jgi:hypothetical protein